MGAALRGPSSDEQPTPHGRNTRRAAIQDSRSVRLGLESLVLTACRSSPRASAAGGPRSSKWEVRVASSVDYVRMGQTFAMGTGDLHTQSQSQSRTV